MPDWDGPLQLDPVVEQWGTGGKAQRSDWTPDDTPVFVPPPPPEPPDEPPAEAEEIEPDPALDWARLLKYALMVAVLGVTITAAIAVNDIVHAIQRAHIELGHQAHGQPRSYAGTAFVIVAVPFGLFVFFRWLTGRGK